ncbi:antibiotic biosynthesis monooxygenase [Nostocoides sp. F2B08]|uniref:putative quinol monooxygenase n=1 Tax=Nostocoides sp. F2B08 TaxID=2653936 RepID=UPI001263B3CF|nr:antibiotic biosynthesis monooxygenase family protein [Tetrasphaera sp. F2B08]KAB7745445.1 antibiotic biosynthesis monooxygenase [Tetrasphaera sp. F2B08]
MIIVAGALFVAASAREDYLAGCRDVVERARSTDGCLDFAVSADLLDPRRVNVYERWADEGALMTFRGSGPSGDQTAMIEHADVSEFRISP